MQAATAAFALALLLQVVGDGPSRRTAIEFTKDTLEQVKENVANKKAVLVDVRGIEEWNEGHLEGSLFVPVTSLRKYALDPKKLEKALPKKAKDEKEPTILYTFCVVGMRAKQAGIILEQQGYTVRALKPGYEQLVEAGFKPAQPEPVSTEATDEGAR
jgi:rhodanese-related sulfurtransferase